jgi:small subunit ribosomal protein S2
VPQVTLKDLLEAGSHFGHQTKRWNPKMKPYIFGSRNGIYIIDLLKTLQKLKEAGDFLRDLSGQVLFVGTKKQAQGAVEEQAQRCSMPYVTKRWLGGTLTNFTTIKSRVNRMKELQQLGNGDGSASPLTQGKTKKEILRLNRERERLEKYLKGLQEMDRIPKAMFVVDPSREAIAIKEALKLKIPVVAIVDTNSDPDGVDYVLPGNDDAIRAIRLFSSAIADAILEGKTMRKPGDDVEISGKDVGDIAMEFEAAQAAKEKSAPLVEASVAVSPPPAPADESAGSAEGKN